MKKTAILQFPGTNCEKDIYKALKDFHPEILPYSSPISIKDYGAFIIPGGFSYGDYLRAGSLAAHCLAMKDVVQAAHKGWPVLGVCNGFQILCEAQLLLGALLKNERGRFVNRWCKLNLKNSNPFWAASEKVCLPIAHGEGRYHASSEDLKKLKDKNLVWLTYEDNPNGSLESIAGIMNEKKNVAGLMPHPERAMQFWQGGVDGKQFFQLLGQL
ncbi:MAG: phosphoribosylformylglycinamidine synthase subunit PurQ [Bdellovibrionales bacterium]